MFPFFFFTWELHNSSQCSAFFSKKKWLGMWSSHVKKKETFPFTSLKDSFCCSQAPSSNLTRSPSLPLGVEKGWYACLPMRRRFETLRHFFWRPVRLFSKMKGSSPSETFGLGEEHARGMKVDISSWLSKVFWCMTSAPQGKASPSAREVVVEGAIEKLEFDSPPSIMLWGTETWPHSIFRSSFTLGSWPLKKEKNDKCIQISMSGLGYADWSLDVWKNGPGNGNTEEFGSYVCRAA